MSPECWGSRARQEKTAGTDNARGQHEGHAGAVSERRPGAPQGVLPAHRSPVELAVSHSGTNTDAVVTSTCVFFENNAFQKQDSAQYFFCAFQ